MADCVDGGNTVASDSLNKVPIEGRESVMTIWSAPSASTELQALLAAVRRSPIVVRPVVRTTAAAEWSAVRKSGHADAFVLAWIASHVRGTRRVPRVLM